MVSNIVLYFGQSPTEKEVSLIAIKKWGKALSIHTVYRVTDFKMQLYIELEKCYFTQTSHLESMTAKAFIFDSVISFSLIPLVFGVNYLQITIFSLTPHGLYN